MFRWTRVLHVALPLALGPGWGCGSSAETAEGSGFATGGSESTGPAATAASTISAGEGSSDSAGASGDASTDDGVRFDVRVDDVPVGETDGAVWGCDTLEQFPPTSVGCEFLGIQVPIPQGITPPEADTYGIAVGNPSDDNTAHVTIEDYRGPGQSRRTLTEFDLAPRQTRMTSLTGDDGLLRAQAAVSENGGDTKSAFIVRSDLPVTAIQLNPLGASESVVAEGSLLLPTTSFGQVYYGVGYPSVVDTIPGWAIVVAAEDDTTVTTAQGTVNLDAYDSHSFSVGTDVTGFHLSSDKPVGVFSGSGCANVPNGLPTCDHLEEQLVPVAGWGRTYVGARHPRRVPDVNPHDPEAVQWRLIAAEDGTIVNFDPEVAGMVDLALEAGEFAEFATPDSFVATSDKRFLLVQYMTGCEGAVDPNAVIRDACGQGMYAATGDPYMVQIPAVEQWGTAVPFLTDQQYSRDFVVVMREAGTAVTLDCMGQIPNSWFTPVGEGTYEASFVDLDLGGRGGEGNCRDGQQFISADAPVGIFVGGVDRATSYAYPGGMNVERLWTPPPVG